MRDILGFSFFAPAYSNRYSMTFCSGPHAQPTIRKYLAQGTVTLLATQLALLQHPEVLDAVSGTGGLLIVGIGINLLGLAATRTGNLMPALFYAIAASLWV